MKDKLPILAIESSDELCSVAVMIDETTFAETSIKQKHIHSEKLVQLLDQTLKLAGIELKNISLIAVSEGPGSFTGLRIGMAVAKGMAIAQGCYFIPVPTIDAIALQIASGLNEKNTFKIVNNINREEVYFAGYSVKNNEYFNEVPLTIFNKKEVDSEIEDSDIVYGSYKPERNNYKTAAPDARYVAMWAYKFGKDLVTKEYDFIEPNYLKNFVVRGKS